MRRYKLLGAILTALLLTPAWSSAKPPRGGYNGIPGRYDPVNLTGRRSNPNWHHQQQWQGGGVTVPQWNGGFGPGFGYGGGVFIAPVQQQWFAPIWYGPQFYAPTWDWGLNR
jgi:hypothetical protein